jgi:hypothetical protein
MAWRNRLAITMGDPFLLLQKSPAQNADSVEYPCSGHYSLSGRLETGCGESVELPEFSLWSQKFGYRSYESSGSDVSKAVGGRILPVANFLCLDA